MILDDKEKLALQKAEILATELSDLTTMAGKIFIMMGVAKQLYPNMNIPDEVTQEIDNWNNKFLQLLAFSATLKNDLTIH